MLSSLCNQVFPALQTLSQDLFDMYQANDAVAYEKEDRSPITQADLYAHEYLKNILEPFGFPILSEESTQDINRVLSEYFWVIDPLDGTKGFLKRTGDFSIMVGLVHQGEPVLGMVAVPQEQKFYTAIKGQGAWLHRAGEASRRIRVSSQKDLQKARFIVSRMHRTSEMDRFAAINHLQLVPRGSNGIKHGLIAEDLADISFNETHRMGLWDVCAAQVIVQEAGGMFTDCKGEKINYRQESVKIPFGVAVSNTILHPEVIAFTKELYA